MNIKARVEKLESLLADNSEGDLDAEIAWWNHLICSPSTKPAPPKPKSLRLTLEDIVAEAWEPHERGSQ